MKTKLILLVAILTFVLIISASHIIAASSSFSGSIDVDEDDDGVIIDIGPSGGEIPAICGDGKLNRIDEYCDGGDLGGETCSSYLGSSYSGSLSCYSSCTFNPTSCVDNSENTDSNTNNGGGSHGGGASSSKCVENWNCTSWSVCSDSEQTRKCTDSKKCGTTTLKPVESRECTVEGKSGEQGVGAPEEESSMGKFWNGITGAVVGAGVVGWLLPLIFVIAIIVLLVILLLAKKKKDTKEDVVLRKKK